MDEKPRKKTHKEINIMIHMNLNFHMKNSKIGSTVLKVKISMVSRYVLFLHLMMIICLLLLLSI